MKLRSKYSLIIINIVIIFMGIIVFMYLEFVDGSFKPIVDITDLHTKETVYHRGQTIQIVSTFCKQKAVVTHLQWSLIDHVVTDFPEQNKTGPSGCFKDKVTDIGTIPMTLSPGNDYYLEDTVIYQINPLRSIEYKFKSNLFEIK